MTTKPPPAPLQTHSQQDEQLRHGPVEVHLWDEDGDAETQSDLRTIELWRELRELKGER